MKPILFSLLLSPLVFAGGSSHATIVVDDFGGTPQILTVGTGNVSPSTPSLLVMPLPGGEALGVQNPESFGGENFFQLVTGTYAFESDGALSFVRTLSEGEVWDDLGTAPATQSFANISAINQTNGSGRRLLEATSYVPFLYNDSGTKYGYVTLSTTIIDNGGLANELQLTVLNYAYQTDGSQIAMGAVPEPSILSLLALVSAAGLAIGRRRAASATS